MVLLSFGMFYRKLLLMIDKRIVLVLFLFGAIVSKPLKSQDIAPQIWNNVSAAWNINDQFSWRNNAAYNALASSEYPWNEVSIISTGVFRFAEYFESTLGIYNNGQPLIANYPDVVTIPRHFKNNGYKTYGGGKILHEQIGFAIPDDWDFYFLWDEKNRQNGWWGHYSWPPDPQPDPRPAKPLAKHTNRNFDWAALENPLGDWPDYKVASWASDLLSQRQVEPFFLGAGMFRPHVPWFQPKEFFDMYNLEDIQLPPYLENDLSDVPEIGRKWAENSYSKLRLGLKVTKCKGFPESVLSIS